MIDALITDFDGVVIDSEPMHFRGFADVLADVGILLTWDAYVSDYMAFDDRDCFRAVGRDHGLSLSEGRLARMIETKTHLVQDLMAQGVSPFPGVIALLNDVARAQVPLAICSGCLHAEIELSCRMLGIWDCFDTVVPAEDVKRGKPDPEGYALALSRLRDRSGRDLQPERCVVIEDSPGGLSSAKRAGMTVLAVTNTHSASDLADADRIVDTLDGVSLKQIAEWFGL